jgi:hypothetical protein
VAGTAQVIELLIAIISKETSSTIGMELPKRIIETNITSKFLD